MARLTAALALIVIVAPSAQARAVLGWSRGPDGQLVMEQLPAGRASAPSPAPEPGSLQRLPMPEPPGETAFDRAIAREREAIGRERAKQRARLDATAAALRRLDERRRVELAEAEERRRAFRAERVQGGKKPGHSKHRPTGAGHSRQHDDDDAPRRD